VLGNVSIVPNEYHKAPNQPQKASNDICTILDEIHTASFINNKASNEIYKALNHQKGGIQSLNTGGIYKNTSCI